MRKKVLLGATVDKEIVFGEFEITNRNKYPEFTASFFIVRPFKGSDVNLEDCFSEYNDRRVMGADWILDQCERLNCSPQNLPRKLADECDDIRDAIDCSYFPEEYEISNQLWYFESSCGGQHDTRGEMEIYVDKKAYDDLHYLWDKYHLCNIGETNQRAVEDRIEEKLEEIERRLNVDWEDWITDYIEKEMM